MESSRLIDLYMESLQRSSRLLLEVTQPPQTNGHDYEGDHVSESEHSECAGHTEDHDIEEAFKHIFFLMLFMASLWFVGKLCAKCGLPSLVGEILTGIVLGPEGLQFVPYADALVVVGEIGLVLLVLEAGIDVSIGHLKVVGFRGLSVAVFGSMLPLGIGTGMAVANGSPLLSAFAIGACLAPTSMGIALNVLRNAKVLNTPTGQLIIAAAVLDDVIALMLLSELEAMAHPTVAGILMPLLISPAFILLFGFLAVKVTPWLISQVMTKTAKQQHENVILLLLFLATFLLVPVCKYAGSSYLLGAFLAGLMFCTDHTIHSAWSNQIKRIMQWMLRIFFACTIGFAVPIQDFWSLPVVSSALMYLVAIVGKIATGVFAKPLTVPEFFTISFSMSAWGEFAFILATASYSTGTIDKHNYSAVLFAVLISVVVSPLALRANLSLAQRSKAKQLFDAREDHAQLDDTSGKVDVYFCVHTKGRGKWGHQDKLLHCIFALQLEIIDFRAFNEAEYNYSHHLPIVQDVFYVRDTTLKLPPTKRLMKADEKTLRERYKEIRDRLREAMGDAEESRVDVMRWLPGVRRNDDLASPVKKRPGMEGGSATATKKKRRPTPAAHYCRKEAYKQARLALDQEDAARSTRSINGISRIRPGHDALHRDRFTYHGAIHTEQDDLIAMAFIDTITAIKQSLSPEARASPDPAGGDEHVLDVDELRHNLQPLVHGLERVAFHMGLDTTAISDNEHSTTLREAIPFPMLASPAAAISNGTHANGDPAQAVPFNELYRHTFPVMHGVHPNISGSVSEGGAHGIHGTHGVHNGSHTDADGLAEHGNLKDIVHAHNHPTVLAASQSNNAMATGKPRLWRPNALQASKSASALPGLTHGHGHPMHFGHHPFHHHPLAAHPLRIPSVTHSHSKSDLGHIPLHHSGTDTEDENDELDTMYGDEERHHRPLYSALDDLNEDPQEYNLNDAMINEKSPLRKGPASRSLMDLQTVAPDGHGDANGAREEEKAASKEMKPLRRSRTWGKLNSMFRHKDRDREQAKDKDKAQEAAKGKSKSKSRVMMNRTYKSVTPAPRLQNDEEETGDGGGDDAEEDQPLKTNAHD